MSKGAVPGAEGQTRKKRMLMRVLRNVLYVGQVSHQRQVYPGEQGAVVEKSVWTRVHALLPKDKGAGDTGVRAVEERENKRSRYPGRELQFSARDQQPRSNRGICVE